MRHRDQSYRVRASIEFRRLSWLTRSENKTEVTGLGVRLISPMLCSSPGETRKMISTWTSVWVKICASWAGLLLYLWTLVAPLLLPNRDFS